MHIRRALKTDVGFIAELELRPEFRSFVNSWPEWRHGRAMDDPDYRYLIFENEHRMVGYAFLNGLQSPNRAIQLCRFVLAEPGHGNGRQACKLILEEAFERLGAHRVYLDLFENNSRAEHLYQALGFRHEGILREAERRGDEFLNLKLMSMLESEYHALKSRA